MKRLPIGTVCTIKGNDKKVMINGYCAYSFQKALERYDYTSVYFPEGNLANKTILFNEEDIKTIEYKGLENNEYNSFADMLDIYIKQSYNGDKEKSKASSEKPNKKFINPTSSFSKLVFDENGVVMIADQTQNIENDKYVFDEEGYIIKEKNVDVVNPFLHKKYSEKDNMSLNDIINQ